MIVAPTAPARCDGREAGLRVRQAGDVEDELPARDPNDGRGRRHDAAAAGELGGRHVGAIG